MMKDLVIRTGTFTSGGKTKGRYTKLKADSEIIGAVKARKGVFYYFLFFI